MSVVERFHARKIGARKNETFDKRPAFKVVISGKVKKQKMTIKSSIQGAFRNLGQEGVNLMLNETKEEPLEKLDVEMAEDAAALRVDPKTLTGSPEETHKEK
jgi:hypothetical protein